MIAAFRPHRRVAWLGTALLIGSLAGVPATAATAALDDEIYATLELPRGGIEFALEPGQLQFFDAENSPFAVQVIDGCAVNDHFWIFAAGLAGAAAPLTVVDRRSGQSQRIVIPALEPGAPVKAVLDPEALRLCRGIEAGGLPALTGLGTYTSADPRCDDSAEAVELLSDGSDSAYRVFIRNGQEVSRLIRDKPVSVVDERDDHDEIHLFVEGRTPRTVEGVVVSGVEGMLPPRVKLDKALKSLTSANIRRAFETARSGRVPKGILGQLGVKGVQCVHHVRLDMETLGADAYLAQAKWIKSGGRPLEPPPLVDDRFAVEVVRADGASSSLSLTGPFVGSPEAGQLWHYRDDDVQAQIVDACSTSGSFWTIAATETDEPVQLEVTDTLSGASASFLLWTDRAEPAWVADTESLPICP